MPRRRLVLLVAAVLGGLVATLGTGSAAGAADPWPHLVALSVTPTSLTPAGELEVHYTATAPTPTLGAVSAVFASPSAPRGAIVVEQQQAPLEGVLRYRVPDGYRNGTYQLTELRLVSEGFTNSTGYRRDGTVDTGGTHTFDFPSMDVTVSGSHEDFAGPVLTSITAPTQAVKPGQPLPVSWSAQDAHPLKSFFVWFKAVDRPSSLSVTSTSAAELAAGRLTRTLPADLYNTKHAVAQVVLVDTVGNMTEYLADGRVVTTPYDAAGQTSSHTLPLASWYVTVTGSTFDQLPPVLRSISIDRTTLHTSDPIKVTYSAQDDTSPLGSVHLHYAHVGSGRAAGLGAGALPMTGSYSASLGEGAWPGKLSLMSVEVQDARGNAAYYQPDGAIRDRRDVTIGRHSLDLSHFDLTVTPDRVSPSARSRPRSAQLTWTVAREEPSGLTGWEVTVNPGGRVVPVPNNHSASQSFVVTGLTNAVKYTFTVRSLSSVGPSPVSAPVSATPLISGNVWSAGDVNGDRLDDLFAAQPGHTVRLYRGKGGATFAGGTMVTEHYGVPGSRLFPADRLFGQAAFYAVSTWDNSMTGVPVERSGVNTYQVGIGKGWGHRFVDGSADFTGDGAADLVGVTEGGTAYLYSSTTTVARFGSGRQIATGWGSMQKVFAATDVTGDKRADLLGVDKDGVLWIFPGTGRGTFSPKRKVSSGWGGLGGLFYARDLNGDGKGDLGAVTMDGTLRVYKGWGNGTFSSAVTVGTGWAPYL